MANTTNYNWETPDDTDLVKDGAAAIRTLGSSVDTTTKALNPSTTLGDIEYRSATANTNTRLPIGTTGQILSVVAGVPSWVANDVGDITAVTAGTGISGGGTTGAVTITNDMATTITAAGDIVVGTGSGTYDNLPIGTTAQVLTADTTVSPYKVKWAAPAGGGGMTSLATGTLSGTAVTISTINQTYNDLYLIIDEPIWTDDNNLTIRVNGITAANYGMAIYGFSGQSATNQGGTGDSSWVLGDGAVFPDDTNVEKRYVIQFPGYALTTGAMICIADYTFVNANSTRSACHFVGYVSDSPDNIDEITIRTNQGKTFSGGTYTLYGVK